MKKLFLLLFLATLQLLNAQINVHGVGNNWNISGNAIGTNTNFIGTTTNRSFYHYTNNMQRLKIDSLGSFTFGSGAANTNTLSAARFWNQGANVDIGAPYGIGGIWLNKTGLTNDNFSLLGVPGNLLVMTDNDSSKIAFGGGNAITFATMRGKSSNNTLENFVFLCADRQRITAGANSANFVINLGNSNWKTASIPTNYGLQILAPTWSSVGASIMTNGITAFIPAPIAGTSLTITNPYSLVTGTTVAFPRAYIGAGAGTSPTAYLHLQPGTATAGTSPFKMSSGTLLGTAEVGAHEFLTDDYYLTITTGAARKGIVLNDNTLTATRVPFATTNGRLTDLAAFTYATNRLSPTYITLAAGTTAAATGPLKFTSGPLMTTAEVGAEEYLTDKRYITITTGAARKEYALFDIAGTSGRVPFETTNGRLTDLAAFTYATNRLSPTYVTLAAGTIAAGTSPLIMTTGTARTTTVAGEFSYDASIFTLTNAVGRYAVGLYLTGSATLDFPSTAIGASSDLTITVTGAALNDPIEIGPPAGSMPAAGSSGFFYPFVSSANTVTIRYMNGPLSIFDPPSGTFKVSVNKN